MTAGPVELTEADAEKVANGLNYEIQPYTETRLPGGWVVYHQGSEEQHATVGVDGSINVTGPEDWTLSFEVPV